MDKNVRQKTESHFLLVRGQSHGERVHAGGEGILVRSPAALERPPACLTRGAARGTVFHREYGGGDFETRDKDRLFRSVLPDLTGGPPLGSADVHGVGPRIHERHDQGHGPAVRVGKTHSFGRCRLLGSVEYRAYGPKMSEYVFRTRENTLSGDGPTLYFNGTVVDSRILYNVTLGFHQYTALHLSSKSARFTLY